MEKLKFGDKLLITNKLVRKERNQRVEKPYPRTITLKVWEDKPMLKLTEVIVIGKRTLWNGERWYEGDAGYLFNPTEKLSAYLVVEKMHIKPYYISAVTL